MTVILLREQKRVWVAGTEHFSIYLGGQKIWSRPNYTTITISDMYGTGLGEIPIHFDPVFATKNASGFVTAVPNLGGAGAAYNTNKTGTGDITVLPGGAFSVPSGSKYLNMASEIDLMGHRLFWVGKKNNTVAGNHKFIGDNESTADGQRAQIDWYQNNDGFRLLRWNGTIMAQAPEMHTTALYAGELNLIEIEVLPSTINMWINGKFEGTYTFPWNDFQIQRIFAGFGNPGFAGNAGDILFFKTNGSATMNSRAEAIRNELIGKWGIVPAV
jgi:hypothetical protein